MAMATSCAHSFKMIKSNSNLIQYRLYIEILEGLKKAGSRQSRNYDRKSESQIKLLRIPLEFSIVSERCEHVSFFVDAWRHAWPLWTAGDW